ncbi:hypothetical protein LTR17_009629 [Elasticomyces elasticus]|nr:hypothetical protein LTR17_009629 [Elasticomyces elasticus]
MIRDIHEIQLMGNELLQPLKIRQVLSKGNQLQIQRARQLLQDAHELQVSQLLVRAFLNTDITPHNYRILVTTNLIVTLGVARLRLPYIWWMPSIGIVLTHRACLRNSIAATLIVKPYFHTAHKCVLIRASMVS